MVRSLPEVIWLNGILFFFEFPKAGNTSCWLRPLAQRDKPLHFLFYQKLVEPSSVRFQDGPWLLPRVASCMAEVLINGGNSEALLKQEVNWFSGTKAKERKFPAWLSDPG